MNTPIVSIANFAGGTGKTTLAHAFAVACAEYGKKALLIDLDPSGALTFKLGHERTRENVITCIERFDMRPHTATDSISKLLENVPEKYDLIIVDTPTQLSTQVDEVFKASKLVVLPVRASIHSLRGALAVMKVTSAPCKALPYFASADSELTNLIANELQLLDGEISIADEVLAAEATINSVLTEFKNSEVAQQYREAAYSLLEELAIF